DQIYLLSKRESGRIPHDVQIFAFISEDFRRMETDHFNGVWKPVLSVRDGDLMEQNVPVPRHFLRSKLADWRAIYGDMIQSLRTVQLLNRILKHLNSATSASPTVEVQQHWDNVVLAIVDSLKTLNESNHSTLVLVFLPTEDDHCMPQDLEPWRSLV